MGAARTASARFLVMAAIGFALVGCRLAGFGPTPLTSAPPSASAADDQAAEPSPSEPALEAPEDCGFPAGASLEFAGRSTYAALRVGDAVGSSVDPMSDDAADIYITRDTFNQGDLHGRLVCAIFVDTPGFVEITVHPEDWGKYTPVPEPGEPANGLSAEEAREAARAILPEGDEWHLELQGPGPIEEVYANWQDYEWGREIPADQWVWTVLAQRENQSMSMAIDYVDGTVIGMVEYTLDDCGRYPSDPEYGKEECPDL